MRFFEFEITRNRWEIGENRWEIGEKSLRIGEKLVSQNLKSIFGRFLNREESHENRFWTDFSQILIGRKSQRNRFKITAKSPQNHPEIVLKSLIESTANRIGIASKSPRNHRETTLKSS
jgi:hypothetical protein